MAKFILWNPRSDKPSQKVYNSQEKAESVARWAAGNSPGEEFIVCELKTTTKKIRPDQSTTTVEVDDDWSK